MDYKTICVAEILNDTLGTCHKHWKAIESLAHQCRRALSPAQSEVVKITWLSFNAIPFGLLCVSRHKPSNLGLCTTSRVTKHRQACHTLKNIDAELCLFPVKKSPTFISLCWLESFYLHFFGLNRVFPSALKPSFLRVRRTVVELAMTEFDYLCSLSSVVKLLNYI